MSTDTLTETEVSAPQRGSRGQGVPRGTSQMTSKTVVNGMLVLGLLYTLLPMVFLVLAVCKTPAGILSGDIFSLHDLDPWSNIRALVHQDGGIYFRWYLNSILYAGVGAVVTGLVCAATGYAFDKYDFRGKEKLYGLVLVGVLIPGTATALPLYLIATKVHLVNTIWAVLIPSVVFPFGVFLARVFSQAYIPGELVEAARIDGAGDLRAFWKIGLPLLKPGLATIMLFQFAAIWQSFYLPYIMLSNEKYYPVSLGLYIWNFEGDTQSPAYAALVLTGSAFVILPIIVAFISLQRYWRAGLTSGALK